MYKPTPEEIAAVKGRGFLVDKTTMCHFNGRVLTVNGRISAQKLSVIAQAAEKFAGASVAMTTRQTIEIQHIPYENIEALVAFLAEHDLEIGGTGPKVRPIVSCKGTTCQYGLIDTFSLSERIHNVFYKGYHEVKLPHKFKIAVGGCPNNCVKPDLNDLGIIGYKKPVFDLEKCRGCKICQIEKACPVKSAKLCDGKISSPDCNGCGRCEGKCPFGAVEAYERGYKVCLGGRWGKKTAMGRPMSYIAKSEDEVMNIVENAILFFKEKGQAGERFADTITRIGFEEVEKTILSGDLLKRKRRNPFKMKKRFLITAIIVCVVCLAALVSCCGNDIEENIHKEAYMTFTDDAGRKIKILEKPKKVAVLFSSYAEMVLLSGGSVDVTVGESVQRGFAKEGTALVDGGAGKKINTELLIAQNPDFVIGSLDISEHNKTAGLMNDAGIPTALFRVESFDDYERVMKILCSIFGTEQKYKENVLDVKEKIQEILSRIPDTGQKKILFVRCASTAKATKAKTKDNNFVCLMLSQMNTHNIAENAPILLDGLSIEEIILENPDFIFFSPMGDEAAAKSYMTGVLETDLWQSLDAVKDKNYVFLDKELFQYKPNNRWDKAYGILAEFLYGKG